MGRWKPPQQKSSPYITAEGAKALDAELKRLWKERREVVKALAAAAAEGDRSENAEYTYRKRQLAGIDRRVRYLSKRLDVVEVVGQAPQDQNRVRFGAWVKLRDSRGSVVEYRLVGADETATGKGWISIDSPVARALLGKTQGEHVQIELPAGKSALTILAVRY